MSVKKAFSGVGSHPISPHIHGLDVRPAFDGNPQSWFDNKNNEGVGFYSAEEDYFKVQLPEYS